MPSSGSVSRSGAKSQAGIDTVVSSVFATTVADRGRPSISETPQEDAGPHVGTVDAVDTHLRGAFGD